MNKLATKKPISIKIVCFTGSLIFLLALSLLYESYSIHNNDVLIYYYIGSTLLSFISIIGIWKMKSIALFIFLSVFIVNHLILITLNEFDICQSLISAIIIIVGFYYLKKMN